MARRRGTGIPAPPLSWRRALGVSLAQAKLSRQIGMPQSRSGRQRKLGRSMGCCRVLLGAVGLAVDHEGVKMKKYLSVDYLLEQEYKFFDKPRPAIGSDEWRAWLRQFQHRYPEIVSRMNEPIEARAYQVCRHETCND